MRRPRRLGLVSRGRFDGELSIEAAWDVFKLWAAEKLDKTGQDAEAYSNAVAVGTLDPERADVLS